jgi:ribonuclease G
MSKELVISATPHETRVAILEDGHLCEIYVEREKEFALVGSIYKGRVTRVLPGMQSAFVDIGLDSDAFLYVSDFLENIEEYDSILTTVEGKVQRMEEQGGRVFAGPQNGAAALEPPDVGAAAPPAAPPDAAAESAPAPGLAPPSDFPADSAIPAPPQESPRQQGFRPYEHRDRGGYDRRGRRGRGGRGRWERRGRDDRGPRRDFPPSKYARPGSPEPPAPSENLEPIILPGESLAKYRDRIPARAVPEWVNAEPGAPAAASSPEEAAEPASAPAQQPPSFEEAVAAPEQSEIAAAQPEIISAPPQQETLPERSLSFAAGPALTPEPPQAVSAAPVAAESAEMPSVAEPEPPQYPAAGEDIARRAELPPAEIKPTAEPSGLEAAQELSEESEQEELDFEPPDYEAYLGERIAEAEDLAADESAADSESSEEAGEREPEGAAYEAMEARLEEAALAAEAEDAQPRTARTHSDSRPRFQRPMRRGGRRRGPERPGRGRFHGRPQRPARVQQITELLKAGQEIIVQIAKEPLGKKGARITSHVALPGRYLVYMPTVEHIGVSRKIGSSEERARLRHLLGELKAACGGGFIVRTAAGGATDDDIRSDVEFLTRAWNEIKQRAEQRKAPALLHRDLNLIERILRDHLTGDFTAIWLDNEEEFTKVVEFVGRFQPKLVGRVKLYTKETPIFEEFGIQQEIDKSLRPKVWLKSGGYIVINHTEALVAIDVNTGKFVGKGSTRLEDTIVRTNLEAVKEIVRQIRLRDLGGIIVIDFIDMEERKNREQVMRALEEALRNDRAPSKALGFNEFGLVAITRKRTKQALERVLCQPCPYCTGSGMVKSVPTICYEIQSEARKMAPDVDSQSITLRVNPEIGKALKTRESALVEELERWTKKSVIIQSDPTLHWEQYDIY